MKLSRSVVLPVAAVALLVEIGAVSLMVAAVEGKSVAAGIGTAFGFGLERALASSPLAAALFLGAALAPVCLLLIVTAAARTGREASAAAPAEAPTAHAAVALLNLLQAEGRLIDFLQEDLSPYGDAQVAAAARSVHAGCKRVLAGKLRLLPVMEAGEGEEVTVAAGFDPASIRVVGKVAGEPPYKGFLRHPGWRVASIDLPVRPGAGDPTVVAPAEVEVV